MTLKEMGDTFCEYTFTAENVKLYIVSGYLFRTPSFSWF